MHIHVYIRILYIQLCLYVHVHVIYMYMYTCIDHELHIPYLLISGIVGMTTLHYIRRTEQKHDMEGGPSREICE